MDTRKKKNYGGGIFNLCRGKNCARVNNTFSYKNPVKDIVKRLEKISDNNDKTLRNTEEGIKQLEKFIDNAKDYEGKLEHNISNAKNMNSGINNKNYLSSLKKKHLQDKIKNLTDRLELVGLQINIAHRIAKVLKKNNNTNNANNAVNIPGILKDAEKIDRLSRIQMDKNEKILTNLKKMSARLN